MSSAAKYTQGITMTTLTNLKKAFGGSEPVPSPRDGPAFPITQHSVHFKHPAVCPCVSEGLWIVNENGRHYDCTICEGTGLHPMPLTEFYDININEFLKQFSFEAMAVTTANPIVHTK